MDRTLLNGQGYQFKLLDSLYDSTEEWDAMPGQDIFLCSPYLRSLELASPPDMTFWYLMIYQGDRAVGRSYFQLKRFITAESLKQSDDCGIYSKLSCVFKEQLGKIELRVLVLGNLLLTGQHGYAWDHTLINEVDFRKKIFNCLDKIQKNKPLIRPKYDVILTKDYSEDNRIEPEGGLYEFVIEPAMEIDIRPHWSSMDDYMSDLQSKYKVRYKRALKKKSDVYSRVLSIDEISENSEKIYELYKNIAKQVAFNIVNLNPHYFYQLKKELGDKFELIGFFKEDELIAFYTFIDDDTNLEAYYVGYNPDYNRPYQIYLNMLYEMLAMAISLRKQKLSLSRTALEIKSSIGAMPHDKYCYLKHNKKMMQLLLPTVIKYFTPEKKWDARHPFKSKSQHLVTTL